MEKMENHKRIDRILESGKRVNAEPNPYLLQKIMMRMKDQAQETYRSNRVLVWSAVSVLTILISVNIYTLTKTETQNGADDLSNVAEAYGLKERGGLNYE